MYNQIYKGKYVILSETEHPWFKNIKQHIQPNNEKKYVKKKSYKDLYFYCLIIIILLLIINAIYK